MTGIHKHRKTGVSFRFSFYEINYDWHIRDLTRRGSGTFTYFHLTSLYVRMIFIVYLERSG